MRFGLAVLCFAALLASVLGGAGHCGNVPIITPAPTTSTASPATLTPATLAPTAVAPATTPAPTTPTSTATIPAPTAPAPTTTAPPLEDPAANGLISWVGYFVQDGEQTPMALPLDITSLGEISGTGQDDLGAYTVTGTFQDGVPLGAFSFTKNYDLDSFEYTGSSDGTTMTGTWAIEPFGSGTFQLQKSTILAP